MVESIVDNNFAFIMVRDQLMVGVMRSFITHQKVRFELHRDIALECISINKKVYANGLI